MSQSSEQPLSFPRHSARSRRFTLGRPRSVSVADDGSRVIFLRSRNGTDPVNSLWVYDLAAGAERLVVDAGQLLGAGDEDLPPEERARRERLRESAGGIVAYATNPSATVASFALSGRLFFVDLLTADVRELPAAGPVIDPRVDPTGSRVAYVTGGALHVVARRRRGLGRGGRRGGRPGQLGGRGVHRGRGDGPAARLLVGALGRPADRGAGRRESGAALAHRRPGQPGPAGRRGRLSGSGYGQRPGHRRVGRSRRRQGRHRLGHRRSALPRHRWLAAGPQAVHRRPEP